MQKGTVRKVIVVDESLLKLDPSAIFNFGDNVVIIPWPLLGWLNYHMHNGNGNAMMAGRAVKLLDDLVKGRDLSQGIPTPQGGFLLVEKECFFPKGSTRIDISDNDNFTIGVALKWKGYSDSGVVADPLLSRKFGKLGPVIIVTKNPALRLMAATWGVLAEDYLHDRVIQKSEELYSGLARIEVTDGDFRRIAELMYANGTNNLHVPGEDVGKIVALPELLPNQCCVFVNREEEKELLAIHKYNHDDGPYFRSVPKPKASNGHVHPRNNEQALAYALLMDPEITLVVLSGIAGGGKSLMALHAGNEQLGKMGVGSIYSQVCICRSNWEMGKSLGYLKGDLKDKWEPWARPVLDLLELLEIKADNLEAMINGTDPRIHIMPINFIQGRSLNRRFLFLDESQNFTRDDVKAFITRAGAGTKVVLAGDIDQIVNPNLDLFSCGLAHVIQHMQGEDYFGCLNMKISERSDLAQQAADLL